MSIIYWVVAIGLFVLMFHPGIFERGWDQFKYFTVIAAIALLWPLVLILFIIVFIYLKIVIENAN